MKSNYLYLLFICVISCLFVSCSDEDNKGEDIPEWNRFRTTNVLVYAHLSAPQSELSKYATDLRSMTQGRGRFIAEFERYDEVPAAESEKIVRARQAENN